MWFQLRNEARITGSTIYNGIGLDTLRKQKEHYNEFIKGLPPKEHSADVKAYMKHGMDNEIHGVATLTGIFMPAFMPPCCKFIEDGANFIHGKDTHRLIEVSTDGLLKCKKHEGNNKECLCDNSWSHSNMIIEIKCPFPNERNVPIHYEIPDRYVTQILAGMKAKNVNECIYVSYSEESTTFFKCSFDRELWREIYHNITNIYDIEYPKKPVHLNCGIHHLKKKIKEYKDENVHLICELPLIKGCHNENYTPAKIKNPYIIPNITTNSSQCDESQIQQDLQNCSLKSKEMIYDSHQLNRKKAHEILTFLLSDSDREKSVNGIDNIPIAYALKGYSLNTKTMWHLIEEVRDKCAKNNIDIICEVSDGQWIKNINQDIDGNPLTKLQYQKKIWYDVLSMKKKEMLTYLENISTVSKECLAKLLEKNQVMVVDENKTVGNIKAECKITIDCYGQSNRQLFVTSNGGNIGDQPLICKVKSPAKYKHIKLWKRNIKAKVDDVSREEVLKLIPRDIMVDFKDSQYAIDDGSDDDITDISLMSCNSDNDPNILRDILLELKKCGRKDIWKVISPRMLFKYYLADAEAIASSFIHAELNCINRVFKETTGQYLFKTNVNKNMKVNKICAKLEICQKCINSSQHHTEFRSHYIIWP